MHGIAFHRIHDDDDQTIVEQEHITGLHFIGQGLVVQAHGIDIAQLSAASIQYKFLAGLQKYFALCELADTDFGALQVGHDGNLATSALRRFSHHVGPVDMVLGLAMAEVEPHHIDASTY